MASWWKILACQISSVSLFLALRRSYTFVDSRGSLTSAQGEEYFPSFIIFTILQTANSNASFQGKEWTCYLVFLESLRMSCRKVFNENLVNFPIYMWQIRGSVLLPISWEDLRGHRFHAVPDAVDEQQEQQQAADEVPLYEKIVEQLGNLAPPRNAHHLLVNLCHSLENLLLRVKVEPSPSLLLLPLPLPLDDSSHLLDLEEEALLGELGDMHVLGGKDLADPSHIAGNDVEAQAGCLNDGYPEGLGECGVQEDVALPDQGEGLLVGFAPVEDCSPLQLLYLYHLPQRLQLGAVPDYLYHNILVPLAQLRQQLNENVDAPPEDHPTAQDQSYGAVLWGAGPGEDVAGLDGVGDDDRLAGGLLVPDDEVVPGGPGYADELVVELVDGGYHPGEYYPVQLFEFEKGVLGVHYPQPKVVALDPEGHPQRAGRLVSVYNVNALGEEDVLGLRVVGDKVGENDVGAGEYEEGEVVGGDPLNVPGAVVVRRVAVGYHDHLPHPFPQNAAHLLDVHLHSPQARVEEVANQRHCHVLLHKSYYYTGTSHSIQCTRTKAERPMGWTGRAQCNMSNSIMFTVNDLISAFDNNLLFAWDLLHAQILHEAQPVSTQHLKSLVSLYSTALEKCNSYWLPHEQYFKHKINQLMTQPKVITCLHTPQLPQSHEFLDRIQVSVPPLPQRYSLQNRKQDLQLRVAYDIEETKKIRVKQIVREEAEKRKKMEGVVKDHISKEEERLRLKIQRRQSRAEATKKLRSSLPLSCQSTIGEAEQQNLTFSFADIPFIQQ